MRDWNTPPPSGAFPAPAEGLPPCVNVAVFDGRLATWHKPCKTGNFHNVIVGPFLEYSESPDHPGFRTLIGTYPLVIDLKTDDPAEAQAAFEHGAEWVRTGEGP